MPESMMKRSGLRICSGKARIIAWQPRGVEAIKDIYGAVPEIGWDRLVEEFLG